MNQLIETIAPIARDIVRALGGCMRLIRLNQSASNTCANWAGLKKNFEVHLLIPAEMRGLERDRPTHAAC